MAEKTCSTCKNFIQHFVQNETSKGMFAPAHFGHCVKPRIKPRQASTKACQYWQAKEQKPAVAAPGAGTDAKAEERPGTAGALCESCRHFSLHYVMRADCMEPLSLGSCEKGGKKHRNAVDAACPQWEGRQDLVR